MRFARSSIANVEEPEIIAESLQEALDWKKILFEASRDAIFISDSNSRFVDVNTAACKLTGYSKEELLIQVSDQEGEINFPILKGSRHKILAGEEIGGETVFFSKDGHEIDVEFSHQRIAIAENSYILTAVRDITGRKRLEAQFLQAQKMEVTGVLAGAIAHDLNNLLMVVRGYTELLIEDLDRNDPRRSDLERIEKAGQQATSLVSQLLEFSRKQTRSPATLNVNEIVQEMSSVLCRLTGEKIDFKISAESDLAPVKADPAQIQQILMNLVVNARDAMPDGGELTIETANVLLDDNHAEAKPGPYVMLAIKDTGMGMDPATRARIFEPFFTTKAQGKGTGLGLSAVYRIAKQNSGFVSVSSEPGKGTTFRMYFPRARKLRRQNRNPADPKPH